MATTASPMNSSTVPSRRSTSAASSRNVPVMRTRSSSGSTCSAREEKPTRSAKSTVTGLRSAGTRPSDALASSSGRPQAPQKRKPAGTSAPQEGQAVPRAAPHEPQKRKPSGLLAPQAGQLGIGGIEPRGRGRA